MDAAVRASKILPPKKLNRVSQSDSFLGPNFEKSSKTSCEPTLTRIYQIDVARFCPRKLFYIFLIAEDDNNSAILLNDLVESSKTYEEVSSLTFISRDDVLALLSTNENCTFPNQLKPLLLNVIESVNEQTAENITMALEVQLLKLKLIQVMYQQYIDQVKKNEKEKNLETLLNTLSKECKRKQKKDENTKEDDEDKNKSPGKGDEKNGKKNKKDDKTKDDAKEEETDYTSIPVDKDGISYEENIFDFIWFYCIKGYQNADIIINLIDQVNLPICAIVKYSEGDCIISNQSEIFTSFWDHIKQLFFGNTTMYKSLENTIIMQFTPSNIGKEEPLVALEEFVFMLRRIVNLKLTYLKYLRHLKINRIQHTYPNVRLECRQQYHRSLRYIPSECVNVELILDAILKEVLFNVESKSSSSTPSLKSLLLAKSSTKSMHCIDPLHDFDAFANTERVETTLNYPKIDSFLVHDDNILTIILKSYKYIGPKVAETTLNLMKRIPVFDELVDREKTTSEDNIYHLHDVSPSSDLQLILNDDSVDCFMYIFLFNMFTSKIQLPQCAVHYDLLNNLTTFNILQFWNEIQSKFEGEINDSDENNIYDISMAHFRWKENLSSHLLLQEVNAASSEFLYIDKKYSPETDDALVIFSDKLDDFGINTKLFNEVIRTPICFRDFCRYTLVGEANWLQENKTKIDETTFKVVFDENCPGAQKIKGQLPLFQEYAYLLDGNIKEDIEENEEQTTEEENPLQETRLQGIDFSEIFEDLQRSSSNINITQECDNAIEGNDKIAYDLGTNLFKVTGKITTFCSHDNVKVSVDNTRFFQYPEKCVFNVSSDGNVLTVHSRESLLTEPYITAIQLKDNSRISFIIYKNKTESHHECCEVKDNPAAPHDNEVDKHLRNSSDMPPVIEENNLEENRSNETDSVKNMEQMVHCVDEAYIKNVLGGKSLDDLSVNENHEDLLESILNARENNGIIYKVNPTSCYLKRKTSNLKVPLENAFKSIISLTNIGYKEPVKQHQIYTKRFESLQENQSDLEIKGPIDFRICLPNGLFIRPHSCVVNQNILMIKQEYANEKPDVPAVQHEEFRLFSDQGLVLIKKVDGTVTLLKANGDIVNFEKPSDGENNTVHPCHCSTLEDFRKKLNKLLKDQENCDVRTSRRGHITSKQNHILDSKILKVLEQFDVPYLKMSITKFDGKRIKIQGDKITQKQLFYLTAQEDFMTGEICFERNDDFRSMFDKYGSQTNLFPDGTIISNSVGVSDELIDDFVDVKLSYKYKHPHYATVKYNFDKTTEIKLDNGVIVKENVDRHGFSVNMEKGHSAYISKENILAKKTCPDCNGEFQAHFDISSFTSGSWNPSDKFMHVKDSYEKHFKSDFLGNCSRNDDYIRSRNNSMKCNHVIKTNYKKLFVINRDFTGNMFCANDLVNTKIKEMEIHPDASVNTYNMISNENIAVVDCRRKFYVRYADRFYNNSIRQTYEHFKKTTIPRSEFYTTFRVFHQMFPSADGIASHVSNMKQLFLNQSLNNSSVRDNMTKLANALEVYYGNHEQELLTEQQELMAKKRMHAEDLEKKKHALKCSCIKQKRTMEEKMLWWRKQCNEYRKKIKNKEIVPYFKSEFCQRDD